MQKVHELVELIRGIIPKAHNRLASAMVFGGLALLIGPPIAEKFLLLVFDLAIDANLTKYDQLYGFGLVVWGSVYHMVMTKLSELSESLDSNKKYELRSSLINECRAYLEGHGFDRREFVETTIYSRLRPHFSEELRKELEKDPNHLTITTNAARGGGVDNFKSDVLDELVEIEQRWGLL